MSPASRPIRAITRPATAADPVADGADAAIYGQLRDLVGNINTVALDTNADAIAHAVATYAYDAPG